MSSVARPDVENLPGYRPACQREANGRPRHVYSMRWLDSPPAGGLAYASPTRSCSSMKAVPRTGLNR